LYCDRRTGEIRARPTPIIDRRRRISRRTRRVFLRNINVIRIVTRTVHVSSLRFRSVQYARRIRTMTSPRRTTERSPAVDGSPTDAPDMEPSSTQQRHNNNGASSESVDADHIDDATTTTTTVAADEKVTTTTAAEAVEAEDVPAATTVDAADVKVQTQISEVSVTSSYRVYLHVYYIGTSVYSEYVRMFGKFDVGVA